MHLSFADSALPVKTCTYRYAPAHGRGYWNTGAWSNIAFLPDLRLSGVSAVGCASSVVRLLVCTWSLLKPRREMQRVFPSQPKRSDDCDLACHLPFRDVCRALVIASRSCSTCGTPGVGRGAIAVHIQLPRTQYPGLNHPSALVCCCSRLLCCEAGLAVAHRILLKLSQGSPEGLLSWAIPTPVFSRRTQVLTAAMHWKNWTSPLARPVP